MNPVTLTIDGRIVTVDPERSILEAARLNGLEIPTLCFHEALPERGSCWLCIVELKGQNRFIPACNTKVSEGMVVETDNAILQGMRRQSLERIVVQHCGDCLGPCEISCPAGCNIPGFVSAIASGRDRDAMSIIMETIPLPGILGRVCPAPCEEACRRHGVDDPVSICALKRHAADSDAASGEPFMPARAGSTGKQVAVVGAGPAGLTAAYYLLAAGHGVTIIDAGEQPGGMMRYGIPRFRLPEPVIEADIRPIRAMGAEFRMSTRFGTDTDWNSLSQDHDALLLAVGASVAARMGIPGEDNPRVVSGIEFLRAASNGEPGNAGGTVVVVGGGNTAVDAARTALRLGAEQVTIMYRRGREEMPANPLEIAEAEAEGVRLGLLSAPTELLGAADGVLVRAVEMELGAPGPDGRRSPAPVEGSEFELRADLVIAATGQSVEVPLAALPRLSLRRNGAVSIDAGTMQTEIAGVFACGDCATGPDLAIRAVAQGRRAAIQIDRFLRGLPFEGASAIFNSTYGERDQAPAPFYERAKPEDRVPVPELEATARRRTFEEAVTGYGGADAMQEARRCMQCRCRAVEDCRLRELASRFGLASTMETTVTEEFAIDGTKEVRFEREKCVDCGICVRTIEAAGGDSNFPALIESCPTGAISA
ncbi:MAG: FAD-dependent oxidoreductase [Chlorobiaceae bacterium]|nr:FAD-dependent oxidoreductase [Chlorobiaceae bacterium]